jgi:hypothetical protein
MIPRFVRLVLAGAVSMVALSGSADAFTRAAGPSAAADEIRRSARMATPVHDWRERDRAWLHHRHAIDRHHHVAPGGLCVDYQPFTSLSCHTFLRHQVRPHGFHQPHHSRHGHHMSRHRGGPSTIIIVR